LKVNKVEKEEEDSFANIGNKNVDPSK